MGELAPLISTGDAKIFAIDRDKIERREAEGETVIPIKLSIRKQECGPLLAALERGLSLKVEHSTRSVLARQHVEIHPADMVQMMNGQSFGTYELCAEMHCMDGQNVRGERTHNLLPGLLEHSATMRTLDTGRLFHIPEGCAPIDADEIRRAVHAKRLLLHAQAIIVDDGVLLPCLPNYFPLRTDLMPPEDVIHALTTAGRGSIDNLLRMVHGAGVLHQHSALVTSTHFSSTELLGILDQQVYDQSQSLIEGIHHGTSVLWDGGKTMGMDPHANLRHLELINRSGNDVPLDHVYVKVRLYNPYRGEKTDHVVTSADRVIEHRGSHRLLYEGLKIEHFLQLPNEEAALRQMYQELVLQNESCWGVLVTAKGVLPIERQPPGQDAFQMLALQLAASHYDEAAIPENVSAAISDLIQYIPRLGDPRRRAVLLSREVPDMHTLQTILQKGVRTVITPNISRNSQREYISDQHLGHYARFAREEHLELFLMNPGNIRMLWNHLFVRLGALDKMRQVDCCIGLYCASAVGSEYMIQSAGFCEFIEKLATMPECHPAIAHGNANSGGMAFANEMAKVFQVPTIGVATLIPGQEDATDNSDGLLLLTRDDYLDRQKFLARMVHLPIAGFGAQGTHFEIALELVLRKIGLQPFSPIYLVDAPGVSSKEGHWWQAISDLEGCFATEFVMGDDKGISRASRARFMPGITKLCSSYPNALEQIQQFCGNPEHHWRDIGISDDLLRDALQATIRNSEFTGLKPPYYLLPTMQRLGLIP